MKHDRYYVQSEHVRGEKRMWWIEDRETKSHLSDGNKCVAEGTRARMERLCGKLNRGEAKP